jgi:catechol 2,3-dioxygenase-like lactoylglutathione lyase family enzyme
VQGMNTLRMDHVGINVQDLAAAKAFFVDLGFEVMGEMDVKGEWVERIIGLTNVSDSIVMLGIGGEPMIELVQFHSPKDTHGLQPSSSNTLGVRHICLAVDDVEAAVAVVKKHGGELMGDIHNYENMYKLCYVRGPEGIIVELAEKLASDKKLFE